MYTYYDGREALREYKGWSILGKGCTLYKEILDSPICVLEDDDGRPVARE